MGAQHIRTAIATGTCVTLGLALAVSIGAVPRASGGSSNEAAQNVGSIVKVGAEALTQHATPVRHHAPASTHVVHTVTHVQQSATSSVASVVPAVQPDTTHAVAAEDVSADRAVANAGQPATKHPGKHHKKKAHHKKGHPAKPGSTNTTPKLAPRTRPSENAIAGAVSGLKQYVHTVFSITGSEVAQFGDEVCSAFDKNESDSQIKSEITAKVKQLPFTTISSGAADYVVRTAVKLYCPGYTSRTS